MCLSHSEDCGLVGMLSLQVTLISLKSMQDSTAQDVCKNNFSNSEKIKCVCKNNVSNSEKIK